MRNKDNFILGAIISIAIFFVLYSILNLFSGLPYLSQSRDSLWVYILSLVPNLILARFMLTRWDMDKTGKGIMFVTLIGIVSVMYIVLK